MWKKEVKDYIQNLDSCVRIMVPFSSTRNLFSLGVKVLWNIQVVMSERTQESGAHVKKIKLSFRCGNYSACDDN